MILNFPETIHIAVKHTSVVLIGDLSAWISDHGQFIGNLFNPFVPNAYGASLEVSNLAKLSLSTMYNNVTTCYFTATRYLVQYNPCMHNIEKWSKIF